MLDAIYDFLFVAGTLIFQSSYRFWTETRRERRPFREKATGVMDRCGDSEFLDSSKKRPLFLPHLLHLFPFFPFLFFLKYELLVQCSFFFLLWTHPHRISGFTEFPYTCYSGTGFSWVSPGCNGFYWVSLGFSRFYQVLPGFTRFYWILTSFTGF